MGRTSNAVPEVELNDGITIPKLGFGVFLIPPLETQDAVARALDAGYRHIDTAMIYRNEAEVGAAIRASALEREDVFVTTKCWNSDQGRERAIAACEASLRRLGLDYVDLYLIHWPMPSVDLYVETWEGFIKLRERGLVRSIGVSNFQPTHLDRVFDATGIVPSVNQVELHPYLVQEAVRAHDAKLGIATEAWSPLAQGAVLGDPVIGAISEAHGKTPGQVVLRWHIELGNIVIPKTVTPSRVIENFEIFDFQLTPDEVTQISALNRDERIGPDPDTNTD